MRTLIVLTLAFWSLAEAPIAYSQDNPRDPAFWKKFREEIEETKIPPAGSASPRSSEGLVGGNREQAEENLNQFLEQKTQRDTLEKLNE